MTRYLADMRRHGLFSAEAEQWRRREGRTGAFGIFIGVLMAVVLWVLVALAVVEAASARPVVRASATCYDLHGPTAHGGWVHPAGPRVAAHNFLPPGARIRLVGRPFLRGMRRFRVWDTGPALADGHFDLWAAGGCSWWGHRPIRYVLGWRKP